MPSADGGLCVNASFSGIQARSATTLDLLAPSKILPCFAQIPVLAIATSIAYVHVDTSRALPYSSLLWTKSVSRRSSVGRFRGF